MLTAAAVATTLAGGLPVTYATPAVADQLAVLARAAQSTVTVTAVAPDGTTTLGSGFFVTADGRLLTSAHVVEGATALTVARPDGTRLDASRVAVDPALDVAELAVDGAATPLPLATRSPDPGASVYVLGNPGGESPSSAARGRITAVHIRARTATGRVYPDLLATDASSTPGASGGPVVDGSGRVVGLVALGDPRSLDTLAIPTGRFRPALAGWSDIQPRAFVRSQPVAMLSGWTGMCEVARCAATADVENRGVSGVLAARFEFWVGSLRVAACEDRRPADAGAKLTLACAVPVDLRAAAGETYTVTAPAISAG